MEISLSDLLSNNTRFVRKVILNIATDQIELFIEMDVEIFAKSTAIVVVNRSTICKAFEKNVTLKKKVSNSEKED